MVNVITETLTSSDTKASMEPSASAVRLSLSDLKDTKASLQLALSALNHLNTSTPQSKSSPLSSPVASSGQAKNNPFLQFTSSNSNPLFTSNEPPTPLPSAIPWPAPSSASPASTTPVVRGLSRIPAPPPVNGHAANSRPDLLDLDSDDDLTTPIKPDQGAVPAPTFYDNEYARATIEDANSDDELPRQPPSDLTLQQAYSLLQQALGQLAALEDRVAAAPNGLHHHDDDDDDDGAAGGSHGRRQRRHSDSSLSSIGFPDAATSPVIYGVDGEATPSKSDILDTPDFHTNRVYAPHETFHPLAIDGEDATANPIADVDAVAASAVRNSSQFTNSLALVEALEQENIELKAELSRLSRAEQAGGVPTGGAELVTTAQQLREQNDRLVKELEALAAENNSLRTRVGGDDGLPGRMRGSLSGDECSVAPSESSMLNSAWLRRRRQDPSHEDWLAASCSWLM